MPDAYDWSEFIVHTYVRAPLERVFRAWATGAGLESFFIRAATHSGADGTVRAPGETARAGDAYHWVFCQPFELRGEFREVAEPRRVRFSFGGMETTVDLRETGGAVEVRLRQTGCRAGDPGREWDHLNCRSCWVYYLTNLNSVLTHGTDLRDPDRPEWTDAVSIGWPPTAS